MPLLSAGDLRHRIVIQRATLASPSASGERARTWPAISVVWGHVKALTGREFNLAQGIAASASHRIVTRYSPDFLHTDRVVWNGNLFHVRALLNGQGDDLSAYRNIWLTLLCEQYFDPNDPSTKPVTVQSVVWNPGNDDFFWTFSAPIASGGTPAVGHLTVNGVNATTVGSPAGPTIEIGYGGAGSSGLRWATGLNASEIVFVGGGRLVDGQTGTTG